MGGSIPADQLLGDVAGRVLGLHEAVQLVAVEGTRIAARALLEMMGHAGGCRVAGVAKGAHNAPPKMDTRAEVLCEVCPCQ